MTDLSNGGNGGDVSDKPLTTLCQSPLLNALRADGWGR